MTLPPEDRDLIERVLGRDLYHATRTVYDPVSVAKLLAAVRAEAAPVVDEGTIGRGLAAWDRAWMDRGNSRRGCMRAALEAALTPSQGVKS